MSNPITNYITALPEYKRKLLTTPEGRRAVCKADFRLFTYVYFRDIMKSSDTGGEVTLSEFHEAFIADSLKYMIPCTVPASSRTAWVCPRGSGKSSWEMMLIIWLGAYYNEAFIALFSSTSTQSEDMLSNIRSQFNSNELLRADFPLLVKPATKKNEAIKLSDNKQLIMQENGFILTGRGVSTSVLGMRLGGNRRPTHIFGDDLEAGESQTTKTDVDKLLVTIQDDIMPLSLNAHFVWVGTTTRPGGLTEGLVHKALDMPHPEWADTENFVVNYWPALKYSDDGISRSIWPERWTTEYLRSQEHTRSFKKNFLCLPAPSDYGYWSPEDIRIAPAEDITWTMISVDPAVTVKESSDFSGIAVVSYSTVSKRTFVEHVEVVKMSGTDLRTRVGQLLELYPHTGLLYIEVNNGGDLLKDLFSPLPVKVKTTNATIKKELRAAHALAEYQKGLVFHTKSMPSIETQMMAFPNVKNDDAVDAISTGVNYFAAANRPKGPGVKITSGSYV